MFNFTELSQRLCALPIEKRTYILSALVRHLLLSEPIDARTVRLLTDIGFVEHSCKSQLASTLLEDYSLAIEQARFLDNLGELPPPLVQDAYAAPSRFHPTSSPKTPSSTRHGSPEWAMKLQAWRDFVGVYSIELASTEVLAFQLAYNTANAGPVVDSIEARLPFYDHELGTWFRRLNRAAPQTACLLVLKGSEDSPKSISVSSDGRWLMLLNITRNLTLKRL